MLPLLLDKDILLRIVELNPCTLLLGINYLEIKLLMIEKRIGLFLC